MYKARLVIKGYEQRFRVYFTKTYALVVNLRSVRLLLALATYLDLEVYIIDVKTAFLNTVLPEHKRVYLSLPDRYEIEAIAAGLLVLKSLYRLK